MRLALFKDASRGPHWLREGARSYNRARRPLLLTYIRRWLMIAGVSFLGISLAESLAPWAWRNL